MQSKRSVLASAVVAAVATLSLLSCQGTTSMAGGDAGLGVRIDVAELASRVDAIRNEVLADAEVSVWLGGSQGAPWFAMAENEWRPSASAIKASYMVELFSRFPELDLPLPGTDDVMGDDKHPAIEHFDAETRDEIRQQLGGATVRRIAHAMIRGSDVSNAVYNAAANVTTAVLGGPEALTAALHRRTSSWEGLAVRRYMLARRDVTGDNEATAAALASVLQGIVSGNIPGIDGGLYAAMRDILAVPDGPTGWKHFFKSGSLGSEPPVQILSGWWETEATAIVYVVIVTRDSAEVDGESAGTALSQLAGRIRAELELAAGVTGKSPLM